MPFVNGHQSDKPRIKVLDHRQYTKLIIWVLHLEKENCEPSIACQVAPNLNPVLVSSVQ